MLETIVDNEKAKYEYELLCENTPLVKATIDQGRTGYCWLISAIDLLLSKNNNEIFLPKVNFQYLIFWDKYERCKLLISQIIEESGNSKGSQMVEMFNLSDKGQWAMAMNLIKHYDISLLRKTEDDFEQLNTTELNAVLNYFIKGSAIKLLQLKNEDEKQSYAEKILVMTKKILTSYLPKAFVCVEKIKLIDSCINEYISVVSMRTDFESKACIYQIKSETNMENGRVSDHYNLPYEVFYNSIRKQVNKKEKVWIACDAGKFLLWRKGIFDDSLFKLNGLIEGLENLKRDDIKKSSAAGICHAMLITDVVQDYFIIKNTRNVGFGSNGYGIMSKSWFDKFVFQAVLSKESVPPQYLSCEKKEITAQQFYRNV